MRALTWQGKRDVRVEDVPDPTIEQPNDVGRIPNAAVAMARNLAAVGNPTRTAAPLAPINVGRPGSATSVD